MAQSGPQKSVRQSITGSGQPRGVVENVGACCCGHLSLGAGAAPSPTQWQAKRRPPTTCPGSCPRLGCLPSGLCACVSPPPPDWGGWCCQRGHRAGSASGEHTLGEGLATRVGPQVSGEACRRGKQCSLGSPGACLTVPWPRPGHRHTRGSLHFTRRFPQGLLIQE